MSKPIPRGLPAVPDPKEYEHLTEKERMLAGYPYRPADPELCQLRLKARDLCKQFNTTDVYDEAGRVRILKEMLHPDCADKKLFVEPIFRADYGTNITVGNNLQMNFDCCILDCAKITIGDNCLVAPNVHIYAATHPIDPKFREDNEDYYELAKPVTIGNNCWIGGQSTICPGVTIGDNVTIGAGSVVTKDIPSNVVIAGNPAKIIRYLYAETPEGSR